MEASQNEKIVAAVSALPAELRGIASRWFDRLHSERQSKGLLAEAIEPLARVVACSEFAAMTLLREWQWFIKTQGVMDDAPDAFALERFAHQIKHSTDDFDAVQKQLR
jgi:hypothetical protein